LRSYTRRNDDTSVPPTMNTVTKLYNEHPKTILFASAAALRLLLVVAFPALPDLLTLRAEISTPVNGFKRCM
jgi:phosphatidylinositol glycan class U